MYVVRPVVVATAHCLLRPRRTLLGCGSERFCASAERRYEISVRAPAPSSTILARAVVGQCNATWRGRGRFARAWLLDPPKSRRRCYTTAGRKYSHFATRTKTILYRLCCRMSFVYSQRRKICCYRGHSRAVNHKKGNTRARQPVAPRPWQQEQPRPPKLWQHRRAASSTHARLLRMRRRVVV